MRTTRLPRARRNGKPSDQERTTQLAIERCPAFTQPLLLAGEDRTAYDALVARVYAVVRPRDILEEMLLSDVVALQWELLRWRRFKFEILDRRCHYALRKFLQANIDYPLYEENFIGILAEFLREKLPEQGADEAEKLARGYAGPEPATGNDKVNELLEEADTNTYDLLDQAKAEKAAEILTVYTKGQPEALGLVTQLLDVHGLSLSSVLEEGCTHNLDDLERLDHLSAVAESRRNAALRELERHRAALAADVRRGLLTAEDAQFEELEPAPAPSVPVKAR